MTQLFISPLYLKQLTQSATQIVQEITPSKESLQTRHDVSSKLTMIIQELYPNCQVNLFGSSATGLCIDYHPSNHKNPSRPSKTSSDLDLCVTFPLFHVPKPRTREGDLFILQSLVDHFKQQNIHSAQLVRANVPIIKLVDSQTGLHCDVSVRNEVALTNTKFIDRHVKMSPCCLPLLNLIKFWAKRRGINEPSRSTLSSFTLNLLVIHYLQQERVLPVLGTTFFQTSKNGLGELLLGFFQYYAQFDFAKWIISATQLGLVKKKNKRYRTRQFLSVEDPTLLGHNVGSSCSKQGLQRLKQEMLRAYYLLCAEQHLNVICQEMSG